MKKKAMCVCIVLLLVCSTLLCSCSVSNRVLIRYYSEKSNYVTAGGVVDHIKDDPELDGLYLDFSDLSPSMDDSCFKLVGTNREIVLEKGILQKVQLGTTVSFMTAPHYFGDGYIMPIVAYRWTARSCCRSKRDMRICWNGCQTRISSLQETARHICINYKG